MAVSFMLALVSAPGLAPATLAESQPGSAAVTAAAATTGYDISWPQCGRPYPTNAAFGIVGVNNGIVYSANPCLADEVAWAGGAAAELYANTANPGPALSTHWPTGQTTPQYCDPSNLDSAACAYDYGYNAAADSFSDAVAAYTSLGLVGSAAGTRWWLDVETSNSWRSDVSLNVAALRGAVGYLSGAGVTTIGFYSTQQQWNTIAGGTVAFAAYPSWLAGASDAQAAISMCAGSGFTTGGVALVQYVTGGFDADVRCAGPSQVLTSIAVSPASTSVVVGKTQQFAATALDQSGDPMNPQPTVSWSASGGGQVSGSGLFTAGSSAGGPFTVTASSGSVSGSATVTITPAPDFAVSVSPPSVAVRAGQTATYQVTVTRTNGFTASASLSVSGLPSGAKATFSPTLTDTTSTLTVRTSKNTRLGTYALTVAGKYGTMARTATATLTVAK
jgi:hypothetical protein